MMKKSPIIASTDAKTVGFSPIFEKPAKAAEKSIGCGAARSPPPPKSVRWLQ